MLLDQYSEAVFPRKTLYTVTAFFVALALFFSAAQQKAFAFAPIDTQKEASLAVTFSPNGTNAAGVAFKLYRAADVSADCRFTLSEKFADYPLSLTGLDSESWRALAQTMAGYAMADGIEYDAMARTGSDGTVLFSGLKPGLYLVSGAAFSSGNYTYSPSAFLVCLPNYEEDAWNYDVATEVKYETKHHGGTTVVTTLTRKALKAWKNDDKSNRPASVSVTLLKNGTAYDTAELTADDNWSYTWTGLDKDAEWQLVEEDVPEGYNVTVSKEGITFLVTNTYTGTDNPQPSLSPTAPPSGGATDTPGIRPTTSPGSIATAPPGGSVTAPPSGSATDMPYGGTVTEPPAENATEPPGGATNAPAESATAVPENTSYPNIPELPDASESTPYSGDTASEPSNDTDNAAETAESEKLPQTGLTWWPVPILALGGMILFTVGWVKQKKDGEGDEK